MIKSLISGVALASRQWKMIALLLALNILASLPLAVPVFMLVVSTTFWRQAANSMFADKLDIHWFTDLFNLQLSGASPEDAAAQFLLALIAAGVVYLLLNTLFSGGIIEILLSEDRRFTMRKFWAGCGAYFWRFFRLMTISMAFYGAAILIFAIIQVFLSGIDSKATAYDEVVYKQWIAMAILILSAAYINMIFDYAKVATVVKNSRGMIVETGRACLFTARNIFSAFGLYLIIALIGAILFVTFSGLRWSIDQSTGPAVLLAIIVGQLAILSRIWTRVAFFAAESNYYLRKNPRLESPSLQATPEIVFETAAKGEPPEPLEEIEIKEAGEDKRVHENI